MMNKAYQGKAKVLRIEFLSRIPMLPSLFIGLRTPNNQYEKARKTSHHLLIYLYKILDQNYKYSSLRKFGEMRYWQGNFIRSIGQT